MKRRDLVRHLERHGCELLREGSNHSVFVKRSAGKGRGPRVPGPTGGPFTRFVVAPSSLRPLKRAIQTWLQNPLAVALLGGRLGEGDHVLVAAAPNGEELTFERAGEPPGEPAAPSCASRR